ncbi:putative F-box/kelch-repeat protein At3g17570 [Arachis ipaensis]|nr:putative F-box/kelch-repeat protein At3g17570 [Arachis ipaensis]XP_025644961.2 putative F-box/kelch-repeat protein At3g17570 [Arachis hypogaea]
MVPLKPPEEAPEHFVADGQQPNKETEWNNNVLEDIFSRLSLKSLARCRCVCKDWLTLVYRPFFFKLNGFIVQRKWVSNTTNSFIQLEGSRENMNTTLLFSILPKDMLIMDTCNGLILCRSNSAKSTLFVWNPVNGQLAGFPFSSMEIATAIASDSYQSCFTSISFPKFKLVRIVSGHRSRNIKFEVYSSETGASRVSNGTYDSSRRISIASRSIYIKGVLYWIMNRQKLLSFHVEEELTSLISLPCNYPSALNHQVIGESEGILHYAQISKPLYLRVWCLHDETWELKCQLNIVIVLEKYKPNSNGRVMFNQVAVLCFKDSMLLLKFQGHVIGYDFKNGKVIYVYSYEDLNLQSPPASPYQKSPLYPLLSVTNVFPFPS